MCRMSLVAMLLMVASQLAVAERDYPITPVPVSEVRIRDGFWAGRIKTNRDVTVRYDFEKCEQTGRIDNFAVAGDLKQGGFQGIFFNDSDVFKVIEGAAYCLADQPDAELNRYLDDLIKKIAAAQEPDGYLYTARTIGDPNYDFPGKQARWSHLESGHELYNVGHLYEAAVAHWQATGKRTLLDVAIQNADLVCKTFGPGSNQRRGAPGHQEIEIGLVKLYRVTGNEKYLQQAKFFVDMRGRPSQRKTFGAYSQDHKPVEQQSEAVGHAVRAGYLYAGIADVAALTGDTAYLRALDHIWENIVSQKMYLTGGVGSSRHGEAFGDNYQLPNETAYNETCAAIAQVLFNHRMFLLRGDAKYIDVLERIIYNGFLAGVSLSGDRFFYPNPLACNGRSKFNQGVMGRSPWFGCSCCPVNVVRFVPSLPGYIYATRGNAAYVNLFAEGSGRLRIADTPITLHQQTEYPWDGDVRIDVDVPSATSFALHVRIPGWARGLPIPSDLYRYESDSNQEYSIHLNGKEVPTAPLVQGYAVLDRTWDPGDTVKLRLPMVVNTVLSHDQVEANRNRVALERGPLVYCVEAVDQGGSVDGLVLPAGVDWNIEHRPALLGGVRVITGQAQRAERQSNGSIALRPSAVTAVPYYAWAHREVGQMAVWLARDASAARASPLPTIASRSKVSASHVWRSDSIDAVNDQIIPRTSGDHSIPRQTWWDKRGTQEWLQYDFANPQSVSKVHVYWFDDTGQGHCRVPASWRVHYRNGDNWQPVQSRNAYTTSVDALNTVRFDSVTTAGLRLEVQLQTDFSAGVLEWQVE